MGRIRLTPIALAALAIAGFAPATSRGSFTYNITDQGTTIQNGYSISGTITVDMLGTLSSSDILSWQYTVTGPGGVGGWTASSSDTGGGGAAALITGSITATATQLFVPVPTGNGTDELTLADGAPGPSVSSIIWEDKVVPGINQLIYIGNSPAGIQAWNYFTSPSAALTIGTIQASAVPEPASVVMMGMGVVGLVVFGRRRRLRARH